VLGTVAIWEGPESAKTACPTGYDEVFGERELYGPRGDWLPYRAPTEGISGGREKQSSGSEKQADVEFSGPKSLPISRLKQEEKGWCYATTSKIIDQAVAGQSLEQWQYVQTYWGKHEAKAKSLDKEGIHRDYGDKFGIENYAYCKERGKGTALTKEIISESLYLVGSPLVLGLGGHSYIMYGYKPAQQQALLWDPLSGKQTDYTLAEISEFFQGNTEVFYSFGTI
jgi:hypothetical protein